MEIKSYPSNARSEQKEPIKKITTGKVVRSVEPKKNSIMKKFIQEDLKDIGRYILDDVLIPAIKNTIVDMIEGAVKKSFYGSAGKPPSRTQVSTGSHVNYSRARTGVNKRVIHNFDDIILETRAEAEEVLDALVKQCRRYGEVTVANLYELVGISVEYTDRDYGWTNLASSSIRPVHNGYKLILPKTIFLQ